MCLFCAENPKSRGRVVAMNGIFNVRSHKLNPQVTIIFGPQPLGTGWQNFLPTLRSYQSYEVQHTYTSLPSKVYWPDSTTNPIGRRPCSSHS